MNGQHAALLLDLDGVLVDTESPALAALATTFADYGVEVEPAEVARRFRGRNLDRCPGAVADVLGHPVPPGFISETRGLARQGPAPRAERHAAEVLDGALRHRIVTNSPLEHSLGTLCAAGLEHMALADGVVAVDRVAGARAKPAPDLYLAAVADLGVAPGDCLAVEDSLTGLRAARAAGVPAVGYAPDEEHRRELSRAGYPTIADLAELLEGRT
jgi:beta-phosphoglucomutase-like phosphatase (HAD superfamily)